MQSQTLLFVYRVASTNTICVAKGISCASDDPNYWNSDASWKGYILPDGPLVDVRLDVTDVVPSIHEPGTEAVYDSEQMIRDADPGKAQRLLALQNCTYIHLNPDAQLPELPFFISFGELTVPAYSAAVLELSAMTIEEIPDVKLYVRGREETAMDKWDRLALQQDAALPPAPLPGGCFLPASLVVDGREAASVYRIRSRRSPRLAEVELFSSDRAVAPQSGSVLVRTARSREGHTETCEIGRIVEVLSHADSLPSG